MESACRCYQLLLSAYADGEATSRERSQVELHLSGCADCRARLADLKALSLAVGARLLQRAEQVDFSRFADEVMRRVTPDRPGFFERLKVGWQEIMTYHRAAVISSMVTAAVTLAVAVPVVYRYASSRATAPEVVLHELLADDPHVKPVVVRMDNGKTLIMLVHQDEPAEGEGGTPDVTPDPPKGGEL
jgi:anti-sigma factor RsiW